MECSSVKKGRRKKPKLGQESSAWLHALAARGSLGCCSDPTWAPSPCPGCTGKLPRSRLGRVSEQPPPPGEGSEPDPAGSRLGRGSQPAASANHLWFFSLNHTTALVSPQQFSWLDAAAALHARCSQKGPGTDVPSASSETKKSCRFSP